MAGLRYKDLKMNDLMKFPSEAELDWLDDFLLNRVEDDVWDESKDEGIIDLSTLDGFMTAIVSAPDVVPAASDLGRFCARV